MSEVILVPTPIGNLEDITLRSLNTLKKADLIAAEDTRRTKILLDHYAISVPLTPLHKDNEHAKIPILLTQISERNHILACVTDAGTPGISDPGYLLIREAIRLGIKTEVLPGATAFVPALVLSGLPSDRFIFEGFLPVKKGRETRFKYLKNEERTMLIYESPHRILKTLDECILYFGADRMAAVCRELTKLHEETVRGTLEHIRTYFSSRSALKGEFVLVVGGKP